MTDFSINGIGLLVGLVGSPSRTGGSPAAPVRSAREGVPSRRRAIRCGGVVVGLVGAIYLVRRS